ncbi:MAG: hypothetical protein ABJC19_01865 [Gemmatimonadota bacterium]
MPHLDEGTIHELLDGEIPSSELPPITTHLTRCAECRARLERAQALMAEADELIAVLDLPAEAEAPATVVTPIRRPQHWMAPVAWAASLVLAAGVGYAARGNLRLVSPQEPVAVNAPIDAADKAVVTTREGAPPASAPARIAQPAAKSSVAPPTEQRAALAEATKPKDESRERSEPAPPAAAPAMAAGGAVGTLRDAASGNAARRADEVAALAPRNAAASKQMIDGSFGDRLPLPRADTIAFPDAMRLLGGNIRLIGGLIPRRLESAGNEVRVIYPLASGELVLMQWLASGRIVWRLAAPAGFPADSLVRLREAVRE